jgi:hypothetical protein
MSPSVAMHGCTIMTPRYRAHARVLAESFLAHHPDASFSVLAIEDGAPAGADDEPFETLTPADVGIDEHELSRRATMYLTQGLATSLKPDLLLALLGRGEEPVLFLDADSCVYGDLVHVAELARSHSLVLTPHSVDPQPLWRVDSPEQIFLRSGVMNAGLIGVGDGALPFLRWWAQRTARDCILDLQRALLFEQAWLTLAPALFDHHVLRDRGCNVAGWNLHARDVQWQGDAPTIDGGALRQFHFATGYDPEHPERLTAQEHARWWPTLEQRPGVARLSREYAARLIERGYRRAAAEPPPPFSVMPGGAAIEPWMRASFRTALLDAEQDGTDEPPNPFSHGTERFQRWLQPHALERVERVERQLAESNGSARAGEPAEPEDSTSARELALAMIDTEKLLARIGELETIRDDAVSWAERVSQELERAKRTIAERDTLIVELGAELDRGRATMEAVWRSPSWRITRPLRAAKALLARRWT